MAITGGCLCGGGSSAEAAIDGRAFELLEGEGVARMWRHPDGGWENWFCPGVRPSHRLHVASAASWEPIPDDGLERFPEGRP